MLGVQPVLPLTSGFPESNPRDETSWLGRARSHSPKWVIPSCGSLDSDKVKSDRSLHFCYDRELHTFGTIFVIYFIRRSITVQLSIYVIVLRKTICSFCKARGPMSQVLGVPLAVVEVSKSIAFNGSEKGRVRGAGCGIRRTTCQVPIGLP